MNPLFETLLSDVLPHNQRALISLVFFPPLEQTPFMFSYSGRHSSDVAGAKAVGWLPRSDGKLLLMCWVGCQVLALLVREEVGG